MSTKIRWNHDFLLSFFHFSISFYNTFIIPFLFSFPSSEEILLPSRTNVDNDIERITELQYKWKLSRMQCSLWIHLLQLIPWKNFSLVDRQSRVGHVLSPKPRRLSPFFSSSESLFLWNSVQRSLSFESIFLWNSV